jgi:UTP--glucose-1-phosphate uridylyltransferase
MNKVRKAVIPAAGYGTRLYPASKVIKKEFFPIVDRDGMIKPIIQVIIEEAINSGIEEVCVIVREDEKQTFLKYFNESEIPEFERRISDLPWALNESKRLLDLSKRLSYIVQKEQAGFGHAVYCAKEWVGDEPFLLLLGDHVYISNTNEKCAQQIINVFAGLGENVCSVMRTSEDMLHLYGTVGGKINTKYPRVYEALEIKEKPTIEYAEKHLQTEGIPLGEYLCFFGQYILMPDLFEYIKHIMDKNIRERGEIQLTSALDMARKERGIFYVYETNGERFDTGVPVSYANTVTEFAKRRR